MKAEPHDISQESIKKRRVKVQDFPLWTNEESVESLMYFIAECKRDGIPLPPDLLEQARRPAPDFEVRKKRKLKKKVVVENEEPQKKKKNLIIRNKGISISETCISDFVNIDPTINHPNTPTETPNVSEPISDQHMTDAPEKNMFVQENEVSEQTVYVSENIIPDTTLPENIIYEQPVLETPSISEPQTVTPPEIIIPSEPKQQQSQQQQVFSENPDEAENNISESPENAISEPSETLPSPVFDDFSKTNFFFENYAAETS